MTLTPFAQRLLDAGRRDRRLRNHLAYHVLSQVLDLIPPGEERWLQVSGLAESLEIHRDTVKRALRTLTQRGYLVRGWSGRREVVAPGESPRVEITIQTLEDWAEGARFLAQQQANAARRARGGNA